MRILVIDLKLPMVLSSHLGAALLGVDRTSRVYTLTGRHCLVWTGLHVSTPLRSSTAWCGQDFTCLHPFEVALLGVDKTLRVYTLSRSPRDSARGLMERKKTLRQTAAIARPPLEWPPSAFLKKSLLLSSVS
ncbi:hypothetical protein BgiMline_011557, partial [Biomphalaria glabrata]